MSNLRRSYSYIVCIASKWGFWFLLSQIEESEIFSHIKYFQKDSKYFLEHRGGHEKSM